MSVVADRPVMSTANVSPSAALYCAIFSTPGVSNALCFGIKAQPSHGFERTTGHPWRCERRRITHPPSRNWLPIFFATALQPITYRTSSFLRGSTTCDIGICRLVLATAMRVRFPSILLVKYNVESCSEVEFRSHLHLWNKEETSSWPWQIRSHYAIHTYFSQTLISFITSSIIFSICSFPIQIT